jgi:hypothetical protein
MEKTVREKKMRNRVQICENGAPANKVEIRQVTAERWMTQNGVIVLELMEKHRRIDAFTLVICPRTETKRIDSSIFTPFPTFVRNRWRRERVIDGNSYNRNIFLFIGKLGNPWRKTR